jgi:L-ascorbate metabolism protein UlaG (beta-lactamase superfamily)
VRVRWYGHSSFLLSDGKSVFVDPFPATAADGMKEHGLVFDYPRIEGVEADVVLVSHEHADHNGAEEIGGDPTVIRSTAGTFDSPVGEVRGVASEHDDAAGTKRGSNVMFCFSLGGLKVCHLGDLGQVAIRPEQVEAIGEVDVLFLPVGAGPTLNGERAADVMRALRPRLVFPMHYQTEGMNWLEPVDVFLGEVDGASVESLSDTEAEIEEVVLGTPEDPKIILLAPPRA